MFNYTIKPPLTDISINSEQNFGDRGCPVSI